MKNLYIFLTIFIITLSSCKAQIAPLYQMDSDLPEGTHFKDLSNNLSVFVGTWKWESNDSIVTIELQKWEDIFFNDTNQYEDMLIGAYKFSVNGAVVLDYLSQLDDNSIYIYDHYIAGNTVLHKNRYPVCDDCTIDQRQVSVFFTDPQREYLNSAMALRYKVEDGIEKMNVVLYQFENSFLPSIDSPQENRIPYGDYIFIKQ
nr:DUF6705 family protein [uncultured Psychroserpens sp.]